MAIEKNSFKVSRLDSEFRREAIMSSKDDEILRCGSDEDEVFDNYDSGAGSDDFDLLELGEVGDEFCQIGDQSCSVPFEIYDLSDLGEILSMDSWNDCLTEEERFSLTKYLPDMDQEMFLRTLKQLFCGSNFHFGDPLAKFFNMMKGGLCEPRVALYRQGWLCFQKRQHCHLVRKYHNTMVVNLHQIRDAWLSCNGYSIEEKIQVLNVTKSQKCLMNDNMEVLESDASRENKASGGFWRKKKNLSEEEIEKTNQKRFSKSARTKASSAKEVCLRFPSGHNGLEMMLSPDSYIGASTRLNLFSGYGLEAKVPMKDRVKYEDDEEMAYEAFRGRGNISQASALHKAGPLRIGKKIEGVKNDECSTDYFMGYSGSSMKDIHSYGRNRTADKLSDIKVLTAKPSKARMSNDIGKKVKYPVNVQQYSVEEQMKNGTSQAFNGFDPFWQNNAHPEALSVGMSPVNFGSKKWKIGSDSSDYKFVDMSNFSEYDAELSQGSTGANSMQNGGHGKRYARCEETESDSSEPIDGAEDNNPLMIRKLAYPREDVNGSFIKSGNEFIKAKISQKVNKGAARPLDELSQFPRKMSHLHNSSSKASEDSLFYGSRRLSVAHDQRREQTFAKKMRLQGAYSGTFDVPPQKSYPTGRKQKEEFGHLQEYALDDELVEVAGTVASFGKKVNKFKTCGDDFRKLDDVPLSLSKWNVTEVALDEQNGNVTKSEQQLENATSLGKREKTNVDGDLQMRNSEPSVAERGDADIHQEPRSQKKPSIPIAPTVHSGFSFSVVHLLSAVRMAMVTLLPEDSLEIGGTNGVNLHEDLDMNKSEPSTQSKVPSLTVPEIVNRVRSNPGDPCILETQEPLQDLVRGVLKIFSSRTAPLGAKGWKSLVSYEKSIKSWSWTGPVSLSLPDHEISEEVTSPEAWLLPHKMLAKLVDAFANWLKSSQETLQQIGSLPNPPLSLMQFNADEKERFRDLRAQKSLNTISPSTDDIRDYFRKEEFLRYSIPDRAFSYTAIDGKKSIVAPLRRCGGKPTSKARDHFMLKRDRPPHVTILCLVRDAAARLPGSIGTRADVCTLIRDSQYIVEDVLDAQVNQVVSGAMDRLHYERDPCVQFDGERKLWAYLHRDREEEDFEDDGTSSTKKWKRQKKEAPEPSEQEIVTMAYHGGGAQSGIDLRSDLNVKPSHGDEHKAVEPFSYDGSHRIKVNVEIGGGSELGEQSGFNLGSDLNAKPSYGDEQKAVEPFSYDGNYKMKDNVEIGVGSELSGFDLGSNHNVKPSYALELKGMEPLYFDGNRRMEDNVEIGGGSELGEMQQSSTMAWEEPLGLNSRQENKFLCQENSRSDDFGDETFVREPPDLSSGFSIKPSYEDGRKAMESLYYDGNHRMEDNVEIGGALQQSSTMAWESLGLNSRRENKLLCQENSNNDGLGDEQFVQKPPDEIISSNLL